MTKLSVEEKGDLLRRARSIGIPRNISVPAVQLVLGWCEASGVEWTIQRLKQIKVDFLRKKGGLPPVSVWIRHNSGYPTCRKHFGGIWGALEAYAFKSTFRFERCLTLLNVYTAFIAPMVTETQARKFFSGVTAKAVPIHPDLSEAIQLGFRLSGLRPIRGPLPKAKPLLSTLASPSKRAPVPYGAGPEIEGVIDSLQFLSNDKGWRLLHDFRDLFSPVMEGLEPEINAVQPPFYLYGARLCAPEGEDVGNLFVGQIGLIQEPGYKLRAVANPGRVFQRVLQPLGQRLFSTIKSLAWDCTFEQSKADDSLVEVLSQNREVFSVDLSGATDYFPLDLQKIALKALLPDATDVDLFFEVSRGKWRLPRGIPLNVLSEFGLSNFVCWTKGQPLGLYPSFAAFALTHGLLLLGLLGKEWDEEFFILGDDVVICDRPLYLKYREALQSLGCPVSESKTLSSTQVAEFRSVIFTAEKKFPQFKWRHMSDDSFVDIIRNMPYLFPLLRPKQRIVVRAISELPDQCGGLGLNPKGKTLDERMTPFMPMILQDYVPRDRITSYTSLIRNLLYSSKLSILATAQSQIERKDLVPALDQRARELVRISLSSSLVPMTEQLGRNLDMVLEGNLDLPIPGVHVGRVTLLTRWIHTLQDLGFQLPADFLRFQFERPRA